MVAKGGKVLVFRKEPTPAEVAAATSDPYEDWDGPAPFGRARPAARRPAKMTGACRPASPCRQNDRSSGAPMTRQEAVSKVLEFYAKPGPFISALEALGVLKLDDPRERPPRGRRVHCHHGQAAWRRPDVVAEDLAKFGLKIVRAR